jgi:hypothetical protein
LADWRAAVPAVKSIRQEMDELLEIYRRAGASAAPDEPCSPASA